MPDFHGPYHVGPRASDSGSTQVLSPFFTLLLANLLGWNDSGKFNTRVFPFSKHLIKCSLIDFRSSERVEGSTPPQRAVAKAIESDVAESMY